jgi:hypothetical protein
MRIVRLSGKPVSTEQLKAYEDEFRETYDKLLETHGTDMQKMHEELIGLDTELASKYANIGVEELPKSQKKWMGLIDSFDAPIMLAKSMDNPKELVLVIVDVPFMG